jgi:glycosyltransferase involved in cell wall biosynthesis
MKKKKLKIAVFCTNEWPTPPPQDTFYAPLWVAYYEAEELAKRGHKVFYFGSKESKLKHAKLVSFGMSALKYNKKLIPYLSYMNEYVVNFYEQMMISKIYQLNQKERFDIIHIHPYRRVIPFAPLSKTPTAITLHDPIAGFHKYMLEQTKEIKSIHLISLSNSQRKPAPRLNFAGTAYNGIDIKKFKFNASPDDFFLAAGRFVPEKGIDIAVEIAKKAGIKLKITGGPAKGAYFENKIKPYLGKNIEYLGMVKYHQMVKLYQKARAVLYPLRWEEPFGLVLVESMACGTPVIGFKKGSLPEVVKDKKTGFLVKDAEEMIKALKKIDEIKRIDCRKWVEENFTIEKMAERYEKIFLKILS